MLHSTTCREHDVHEKHITIENNIAPGIMVRADRVALEELLDNLLVNAIKFTPDGGVIKFNCTENEGIVTVSIIDSGIGMTEDQLKRVFDDFYRADPSRHDLGSSGLGLSICKRIIERHGGRIWAESPELGQGSIFHFTLSAGVTDSDC